MSRVSYLLENSTFSYSAHVHPLIHAPAQSFLIDHYRPRLRLPATPIPKEKRDRATRERGGGCRESAAYPAVPQPKTLLPTSNFSQIPLRVRPTGTLSGALSCVHLPFPFDTAAILPDLIRLHRPVDSPLSGQSRYAHCPITHRTLGCFVTCKL